VIQLIVEMKAIKTSGTEVRVALIAEELTLFQITLVA
jgi:hypothetical protein